MENEIMNNELNTELTEAEAPAEAKNDNTAKALLIGAGTGVGLGYAITRLVRHIPGVKKLFIKQDRRYLAKQGDVICNQNGEIILMVVPKTEEPKTEETTEETK